MDANAKYELDSIKRELQSIIYELDEIANGLRYDFKNIGSEQVATCVVRVADNYRNVKRKLDNIDTKKLTKEFEKNLVQ